MLRTALAAALGIAAAATTPGAEAAAPSRAATKKPHVVVLLADNVGWAAVSWHKPPLLPSTDVHTPTLDGLRADGIELDRHYTCAPASLKITASVRALAPKPSADTARLDAGTSFVAPRGPRS